MSLIRNNAFVNFFLFKITDANSDVLVSYLISSFGADKIETSWKSFTSVPDIIKMAVGSLGGN